MLRKGTRIALEPTGGCARRILQTLGSPPGIAIDTACDDVVLEIGEPGDKRLRLNGRLLAKGRCLLLGGEVLRYRHHRVQLIPSISPEQVPGGTRTLARAVLAPTPAALPHHGAHLVVMEGDLAGRRWPLYQGRQSVGRSVDAEIVIAEPSVSRRHAELLVRGEVVSVRDLSSRHGLRVGRRRIFGRRRLKSGDELLLGLARLRLVVPGTCSAQPLPTAAETDEGRVDWWIAAGALGLLLLGGALSTLALAS